MRRCSVDAEIIGRRDIRVDAHVRSDLDRPGSISYFSRWFLFSPGDVLAARTARPARRQDSGTSDRSFSDFADRSIYCLGQVRSDDYLPHPADPSQALGHTGWRVGACGLQAGRIASLSRRPPADQNRMASSCGLTAIAASRRRGCGPHRRSAVARWDFASGRLSWWTR